jgi:peptidoglycan/xylan/chitin deacetylase (PgdA/CDA1 family)
MDDRQPADLRPAAPRPGRSLASPAVAASLAIILIALVAAILVIPGLLPGASTTLTPGASNVPTSTPGGSPGGSPSESPTPLPSPTFARPTPTPLPTFTSYTVRQGDSLNSIADDFATTARSLAWWNRGTYPNLDPQSADYDPNHIEPGWVLVLIPGVKVDDASPPTPSPGPPTPQPTVGPTTAPGSSPIAGGPATVVSHGTRGSAQVALTFDMGGRLDPAVDIVQWLIDHDVHATLFPTGSSGTTTAEGRAVLQLAAARPDLFAIGNHSWDHPDFTTLSADQMSDQLSSTDSAIRDLIGVPTTPWFRPPNGAWTYDVRVGVGAAGWSRLVMWDVDTIDWKTTADGGPTADDIVTKVVSKAQGGSIVLMHLGGWHTLEALPGVVSGLASRGLTPVRLSDLAGA